MYGRICILLLVLFSGSASLLAQDTIRAEGIMDSHLHRSIRMGILLPALAPDDSTSYGWLDLRFDKESGDFHRAQQAFSKSAIRLHAMGFNQLGRFRVAGDFRFEQTKEDSLANLLSGEGFDDLHPYYYFATKHSHYTKQGFLARARIDYELIRNKLALGLGIRHRTYWAAGTVDPRPRVELFNLELSPGVLFIFDQTKVGLDFRWARGSEDINVTYKNRNYGTGISDPSRIRYINLGYGTMSTLDTASLRKYNDLTGLSLSFKTEWQDWLLQSVFVYEKSRQYNSHNIVRRSNYYIRSSFDLETIDTRILISKETEKMAQQIGLALTWQDGQDFSTALTRTNYLARASDMAADYSVHLRKRHRLQYEMGMKWTLERDYRKDGGQAHEIDYSVHTFGLSGGLHLAGIKQHYRFSASPYYRHPGRVEASFPATQLNIFSEAIAIPDFIYVGTRAAGLDLRLDYAGKNIFKSYETVFYLQYGHLRSVETISRKRNYFQAGMALAL